MAEGTTQPTEVFSQLIATAEKRARDRLGDVAAGETVALGLLMRRVNNLMAVDAEHEVLRDAGLTWASFRVCFALWVHGPQEPHRVAVRSSMSKAAVSAAMKVLVARGFVVTEESATDLRSIVMSLTDEGAAHIETTYRAHLALTAQWLAPLSGPEQQILAGLLGKVMAGPRAAVFGPDRTVNG